MRITYDTEFYYAMMIHATTWKNPKEIMLIKKSQGYILDIKNRLGAARG